MSGYIIAPINLTERQMLIYMCLYKRCNFENMQTDMTISQIRTGIKIVDLTEKIIYNEIQKMIKLGYLSVIAKARKGHAPTYKIIKVNEIGKPKVNQGETKEKSKVGDCNSLSVVEGSDMETIGKPKVCTINEKEKEKDNIYSLVIEKLNKTAFTKFKYSSQKTKSLINARVREGFSVDDFEKVIDIKAKEWIGTDMEKYLRPQTLFGTKFESYLNQKEKTPIGVGASTSKKYNYNNSICKNKNNNTQEIIEHKFV